MNVRVVCSRACDHVVLRGAREEEVEDGGFRQLENRSQLGFDSQVSHLRSSRGAVVREPAPVYIAVSKALSSAGRGAVSKN